MPESESCDIVAVIDVVDVVVVAAVDGDVGSRRAILGGGRRLNTVTAGLKGVVVGIAGGEVKEEAPGILFVGRYWWKVGWGVSLLRERWEGREKCQSDRSN